MSEKRNQSAQNAAKKGGPGSSEKERRALKVQEKHKQDGPKNNIGKTGEVTSPKPVKEEAKVEVKKQTKVPQTEAPKISEANSIDKQKQLAEKEARKLEWQKKLAEQNKDKAKDEGLSKAELKEKRRQQQEAQRQAKLQQTIEQKPSQKTDTTEPKTEKLQKVEKTERTEKVLVKKPATTGTKKNKILLVNHLYAENSKISKYETIVVNYKNVHPTFVRLGVQHASKIILGSNARCLSLLSALKHLIQDLQTPPKQEFCRYLDNILQHCVDYLQYCRPLAVSMTNALRHFKVQLTQEATKKEDNEKKPFLLNIIETYVTDQIHKAGEAISLKVNEKISKKGDIILTYGCSSLIRKILLDAHKEQKQFQVIIVDGRPFLEGRQMLHRLVKAGIQCTYIQINAVCYVMHRVTKVLLPAHALLANGYVMSRIGTAQVAMVARAYNKPVLVCCETYKFSERVQTDSFVYNEIGDNNLLAFEGSALTKFKNSSNPSILNLLYDVTPPDLVTAVVTELAIMPCTSVPVVLRIKPTEFI